MFPRGNRPLLMLELCALTPSKQAMQQRDVVMSEAWPLVWNTNMSALTMNLDA